MRYGESGIAALTVSSVPIYKKGDVTAGGYSGRLYSVMMGAWIWTVLMYG